MSPLEFWVFLPQMRLSMEQLVERARAAEAAGFSGVAGMCASSVSTTAQAPSDDGQDSR